MKRLHISQGSVFEETIGYSRAVVDGRWVFVSGTTGFDYTDMSISDDPAEQADQTFCNINWALEQAQAAMKDIVRVTFIVPNRDDFELCWPVIRHWLAPARPAATMISAQLHDPRMKIEIEATALKPA